MRFGLLAATASLMVGLTTPLFALDLNGNDTLVGGGQTFGDGACEARVENITRIPLARVEVVPTWGVPVFGGAAECGWGRCESDRCTGCR